MPRSCCAFGETADRHFNAEKVQAEVRQYRRKGPGITRRKLRDGLVSAGLTEGTVLDIGGGLGGLSLTLLDAGMSAATVVDATAAYLAAASEEAGRSRRSTSMQFVHGDFLVAARDLPIATVVVLDRVVCLGHRGLRMVMRYAHLSPAYLSAEVSLLDAPARPRAQKAKKGQLASKGGRRPAKVVEFPM